jgi:hypothetical protein
MSQIKVRAALETALAGISASIQTAWENFPFTPPAQTTEYQRVHLMFAAPDNSVFGSEHIEQGYMQVTLLYPQGKGTNDANTRAETIRSMFARGSSFTSDGVTTVIRRTPEISNGSPEDGRFALVLKIPFFAHIN